MSSTKQLLHHLRAWNVHFLRKILMISFEEVALKDNADSP
jgi:hypothetical protein